MTWRWEKDAPDHWSACKPDTALSVWPRVNGQWVWEIWDRTSDADDPNVSGVAETFNEAKRAAEAAVPCQSVAEEK